MGYITDYTLTSNDKTMLTQEFSTRFIELTGYDSDELYDLKWYEHEEDMTTISKMYLNTVFTLKGIGEDDDQPWYIYFKNGKQHSAKVVTTIEPFDESKLQ